MIKSSIVVPSQTTNSSARKRSIDQDNTSKPSNDDATTSSEAGTQECKKPRLAMNADSKRRGQRMFGVLLGTLNKFKDDTKHKTDAEKKREEIDSKLHEKLVNEKKELEETMQADKERRDREATLLKKREERVVEEKREATYIQQKESLANYIKTKTEPRLLYRPKNLTDEHEKEIEEQKALARKEREEYESRKEQQRVKDEEESIKHEEQEEHDENDSKQEDGKPKEEEEEKEEKELSPHLESPAPEDAVVADRDDE
ncbi:pinin/SDK/memA/ protein conserved region-domain-containing protein [Phascolomyces articulosus]|uniref:Pinin/SDK/memA/ protein conserved region-domain-containing protein n=1 Tax=Phascolomyces articulosus TaxID=60185 RepID=A0AAD5JXV8_9FUNG|nr:pinin/SDK/memA/ protein conserved region-domain-containing protein [Phascolomyces articulosus]